MVSDKDDRAARLAARSWANDVFGAPARFDELVTHVEARDEVVTRIATRIEGRAMSERRAAASSRQAAWQMSVRRDAVDRSQIDPFAHTPDSLRASTERVVDCATCAGSGSCRCAHCSGSGRMVCGRCYGSGKQASEKTGRPINCKVCKKSGSVDCNRCSNGRVACSPCGASGQQLSWLVYEESVRWDVAIDPGGPVAISHPVLTQQGALAEQDCPGLVLTQSHEAKGRFSSSDLASLPPRERAFVEAHSRVRPLVERITYQQLVWLDVVRRDVSFEMGGTRGTLVLTGTQLAGATTDEAMRPIRRRNWLWGISATALLLVTLVFRLSLVRSSAYFDPVRVPVTLLCLGSMAAVIPALGGFFRSWRGGLRRWKARGLERGCAALAVVTWFAMLAVGGAGLPAPEEVNEALAAKDPAKARLVLEAMKQIQEDPQLVANLEDRVLLAEASAVGGDPRLALLEKVTNRGGPSAQEGKIALLAARVEELRRLTKDQNPTRALELARQWYPRDEARPAEVVNAMADAADAQAAACGDAVCRLVAQRTGASLVSTPARQTALATTRAELLGALEAPPKAAVPPSELLGRLVELRSASTLAARAKEAVLPEDEIALRATDVMSGAAAIRGKVPLLGASPEVVGELIGRLELKDGAIWTVQKEGPRIFAVFDGRKLCRGLYMVPAVGRSTIPAEAAEQLVAQALGKSTAVRAPKSDTPSTLRWAAGGVRLATRGSNGQISELRIGAAEP